MADEGKRRKGKQQAIKAGFSLPPSAPIVFQGRRPELTAVDYNPSASFLGTSLYTREASLAHKRKKHRSCGAFPGGDWVTELTAASGG